MALTKLTDIRKSLSVEVEDLKVNGITTFTGSVSIGGTLTYEDVTNIDSIGIITARSTVSIADSIVHTGDTNTSIRFPAADTFTVETAGVERLRIASDGKVGIGTDTPNGDLQIRAGANASFRVIADPSTSGLFVGNYGSGDGYRSLSLLGSDVRLYTITAGALSGAQERVHVDSSGNVHVGFNGESLYFQNGFNNSNARIQNAGSTNNSNLRFLTRSSGTEGERLRITSDGNLNIGGNFSETSHPLNVSHSTKPSFALHTGTTLRADLSATTGITSIRSYANSPFTINIGGSGETEALRIDGSGNLVTGAQTSPTSSDNGNIYIKNAAAIGAVSHQLNYVTNAVFNSAWKYITSSVGATRIVVNQSGFQFDTAASGTANNNITFSNRFNISNAGAIGVAGAYGTSGQVLTSAGSGSAPTWATPSAGVTIANNADNKVITGGSGTNLNAESNVYIDSNGKMSLGATSADRILDIHQSSTNAYQVTGFSAADNSLLRIHNPSGTDNSGVGYHTGLEFVVASGANSYGQLGYVRTGNNIGDFFFKHRTGGSTYRETLRVKSDDTILLGGWNQTGSVNSNVVREAVKINCSTSDGYDSRHLLTIGQTEGNWLQGTSGGDSSWGLMWHYAPSISATRELRAGIAYDHSNTEQLKIWSSYGSIAFYQDLANGASETAETCDTKLAEFDTNGSFVPGANNARDLGTSSLKWRNIHVMDMHFSNDGGDPNCVDGTTGNWTLQEGENGIYMINNKNGKKYEMMLKEVQ